MADPKLSRMAAALRALADKIDAGGVKDLEDAFDALHVAKFHLMYETHGESPFSQAAKPAQFPEQP